MTLVALNEPWYDLRHCQMCGTMDPSELCVRGHPEIAEHHADDGCFGHPWWVVHSPLWRGSIPRA